MQVNPYEPPQTAPPPKQVGPIDPKRDILRLAKAQHGMMWIAVLKLGFDFSSTGVAEMAPPLVRLAYSVLYIIVTLALAWFVFQVADSSYGMGPGIICAVLTMVPCMGLIGILILNGNAQDRLRKAGVKVGMMGASKQQLQELELAVANLDTAS